MKPVLSGYFPMYFYKILSVLFTGISPGLRTLPIYNMISINISCLNEYISEWLNITSSIIPAFLRMTYKAFWNYFPLTYFISPMIQVSAVDDTTFSKLMCCSGENMDFCVREKLASSLSCSLSFWSF